MVSDVDKLKEYLGALPVFPLPTAVLLPYEILPLHIFEPRYRAMVQDALENERPIAIAELASGWEGNYEGRPPVESVCGVGFISRHERLDDGRYNILIRGVARIRLDHELEPRKLYREFHGTLLDDHHTTVSPAVLEEAMESLHRVLFALCAAKPGAGASALAQLAARAATPSALADIVAAAIFSDYGQRKRALVTIDVAERLVMAQTAIAELLVGSAMPTEERFRN